LKDFVDKHRHTHGVESICKALQIAPSGYRRHAACQRKPELRCARAKSDDALMPQIQQVWQSNMQVYGADKVWHQMRCEGIEVARCTVERLIKRMGLQGVRRGKVVRTTTPDKALPCLTCPHPAVPA
jgi:putative transposase